MKGSDFRANRVHEDKYHFFFSICISRPHPTIVLIYGGADRGIDARSCRRNLLSEVHTTAAGI